MSQFVKIILKYILVYSQYYKLAARMRFNPSTSLRILSFHKIYPVFDPFFPGVTLDQFRKQLNHLQKNYKILKLSQALKMSSKGETFDRPTVCITFDDGFKCVFDHAYPILEELNIPATIFLTTGCIGSQQTIWTDHIAGLIKNSSMDKISINDKDFHLTTLEGKLFAVKNIKALLKEMKKSERVEIIKYLWNVLKEDYNLEYPFLSWQHIAEMKKELIEYGAHTVSHPILSKISSNEQLLEIKGSQEILGKKLQQPVDMFAYPNGLQDDYNEITKDILKKQGFKYAFLNYGGLYTNLQESDLEIPRISEVHSNKINFALRVAGLF